MRPGIALYGGNPTPDQPNPMRPVVELKARIVQLRHVPAGESVGYDAEWVAPRASRIAIIAVGYADGILRSGSAPTGRRGGEVVVAGHICPFIGRVSMDLIAIDLTDLPEGSARRGDLVTLIGDGLDLDTMAARLGTISYEVLTQLGSRYARIYRGAE